MRLMKLLPISVFVLFATIAVAVADDAAPLKATNEYYFVGDLGIFDGDGRLLAWEGFLSGDIAGMIRLWMVVPFLSTGQVTHFEERWEVLDDSGRILLLEGYNAGTTTNRPNKSGVWRSNGIVTYANPDYPELARWYGRNMYESGELFWVIPEVLPSHSWGIFRIN